MSRILVTSLLLVHVVIYLLRPSRAKSERNSFFTSYVNDGPYEPWEGI